MVSYTQAAVERAMKVQEVILRAMAKKITWWQDIRECMRRALMGMGIGSKQYGFLWCDEFGGWDPKKEAYNTNLHAHGVYVGPYIPQDLLAKTWTEIRAFKDGAKVVWIEKQKIDNPQAVQEFHAPRGVLRARCCHRVKDNRGFLPLELVHGSEPRSCGKSFYQRRDLRVVRRHDEDVLQRQGQRHPR